MKSPTELHQYFVESGFNDKQARSLLKAFHELGLIPSAEPGHELDLIDEMLVAKPFVGFKLRCGKTEFHVTTPDQARFNRFGSLEVRTVEEGKSLKHTLFPNHIAGVEPL